MGGRREIKYLPWTNRYKSNLLEAMAPFFPMNSAILSDSDNVTAFGVADAPRVQVRAHGEKSSTHAQSHLGMPNRRNKVTKNGNGPSEGLFAGTPVQP
ncbi:hypothetical protein TNCV_2913781 [Trichonephila clavipes]|nr:hypothetical protein TNCV_2913781 [Trichonephila clavipes]